MTTRMKEDFEIPDKLKDIYRDMEVFPVGILKKYALNLIHSKIQKYEAETSVFEKKYGQTFEEFKRKIESMENEEHFAWEDDLNDWEFVFENLKYWRQKAKELQGE